MKFLLKKDALVYKEALSLLRVLRSDYSKNLEELAGAKSELRRAYETDSTAKIRRAKTLMSRATFNADKSHDKLVALERQILEPTDYVAAEER